MVTTLIIGLLLMAGGTTVAATTTSDLPYVIDEINALTEEQRAELEESAKVLQQKYNVDVVYFLTKDKVNQQTAEAAADDYYDYKGYGRGEDNSGVLIVIDMGSRYIHISTAGRMITVMNDVAIQETVNRVGNELKKEDYNASAKVFHKQVANYLIRYNQKPTFWKYLFYNLRRPSWFFLAIILGVITTGTTLFSQKPRQKALNAFTYEARDKLVYEDPLDQFLTKNVALRHLPQNSSSGFSGRRRSGFSGRRRSGSSSYSSSGSSTHRSSSGRRHGGGGGSF